MLNWRYCARSIDDSRLRFVAFHPVLSQCWLRTIPKTPQVKRHCQCDEVQVADMISTSFKAAAATGASVGQTCRQSATPINKLTRRIHMARATYQQSTPTTLAPEAVVQRQLEVWTT
jgi:hypothetical protein